MGGRGSFASFFRTKHACTILTGYGPHTHRTFNYLVIVSSPYFAMYIEFINRPTSFFF